MRTPSLRALYIDLPSQHECKLKNIPITPSPVLYLQHAIPQLAEVLFLQHQGLRRISEEKLHTKPKKARISIIV
jgi:hypothetical protein